MVWKWYAFSSNCTLNFDFFPKLGIHGVILSDDTGKSDLSNVPHNHERKQPKHLQTTLYPYNYSIFHYMLCVW